MMSVGGAGRGAPAAMVRKIDPVVAVQVYVIALIASPSVYVVGPLGAAGTPATIVGFGLFAVWLILRFSRSTDSPQLMAVHRAVALFACAMLVSFAAGMLRPISALEVSSSMRGLISVASWCGVVLFTVDSARLDSLVPMLARTISVAGAVQAALGIIQFFTGIDYVSIFHIPGLTQNASSGGLYERSGFTRVSGTAIHSIEFAVVLSVCLPIAIQIALVQGRRLINWLPPVLMFVALLLTVSRSGAIGLGVGVATAFVIATRRQRRWLLLLVPAALVFMRAAVPGLIGTIRSLFLGAGEDTSIGSRVDDYAAVGHYIAQSPLAGRGVFTFTPTVYRVLDNQYLATIVEAGFIGLVALLGFFVVPMVVATRAARRATSRDGRTMGIAVVASLIAAAVLAATFDMFGFPMAMGMTSAVVGLAAAIAIRDTPRPDPTAQPRRTMRRWAVSLALVALFVVGPLLFAAQRAAPVYEARDSISVAVNPAEGQNFYNERISSAPMAEVLATVMEGDQMRVQLAAEGVDYYEVAIGAGSLEPYTDIYGAADSEMVRIAARGATVDEARANAVIVRRALAVELARLQRDVGVAGQAPTISLQDDLVAPEVFLIGIHRLYALVAAVVVGVVVAFLLSRPPARRPGPAHPPPLERVAASP